MNRFFILPKQFRECQVFFSKEESFQIKNVLRLKRGRIVSVMDNRGGEWEVELRSLSKNGVVGEIRGELRHPPLKNPIICLATAVPSAKRMNWMLQKSTELGVGEIIPFSSKRAVRRSAGGNRAERWKKIVKEAAEQSGRAYLPLIRDMVPFPRICANGKAGALKIILWEGEKGRPLGSIIGKEDMKKFETITVVVGPEGGFEPYEVESARVAGFIPASLGEGILRVETAALTAIGILQFSLGRIG